MAEPHAGPTPYTFRELIVLMRPQIGPNHPALGYLAELVSGWGGRMEPEFPGIEDEPEDLPGPRMSQFYVVWGVSEEQTEPLAEYLRGQDGVAEAWVNPPAELAENGYEPPTEGVIVPSGNGPPGGDTPNFEPDQEYLRPFAKSSGIDADRAWAEPHNSAGRHPWRGDSVKIVDVEYTWRWTHENVPSGAGGSPSPFLIPVPGAVPPLWGMANSSPKESHGTAVLAMLIGTNADQYNLAPSTAGVRGICPEAQVFGSTISGVGRARAIYNALLPGNPWTLGPGDIILLETTAEAHKGLHVPAEWELDVWKAVLYATSKGVIVVQPAGNNHNGADLDDPTYDSAPPGLNWTADGWSNPLKRAGNSDTGAIIVGAGAPRQNLHQAKGRPNHGPARSRLPFSNYGTAVDAQGWGREVTTAGYGNLQGGTNMDEWYTDWFAGTSAAAAMVAGVLACVLGATRAGRPTALTKEWRNLLAAGGASNSGACQTFVRDVRTMLRDVGRSHPQTGGVGNIGRLPDLSLM